MAGPVSVGTVYIKVRPNTKGFRQEVERDLAGLRDVKVKVDPNTTGLKQKIERAADGVKTKVRVDVDKKHLKGQLGSIQKAAPTNLKTTMKVVANTNAAVKSLRGLESYLDKFSEVDVFDFNTSNGAAERLQWKMLGVRQSLARSTAEAKNLTEHLPGKDDIEEIRRIGQALDRMFRKDYGTPDFADLPGIPALKRQTRRWMSLLRSRSREAADAVASPFRSVGDVVGRQMSSAADKAGSSIRRSVSDVASSLKSSPKKILDSARDLGYFFGTEFEKGYNQRADRDGFGGSLVEDVERLRQRTRAARLEQQLLWDMASKATKKAQAEARNAKKRSDSLSLLPIEDRGDIERRLMGRAKAIRKMAKEYRRANKDWDGHRDFIRQQNVLEESIQRLKNLNAADFRDKADGLITNMRSQAEKLAGSKDKLDKFSDSISRLQKAYYKIPDVQGPSLGPMEKQVREAIRLRREYENASRLGKARIWARDTEAVQRLNRGLRTTADNAKKWGRYLNVFNRIPASFKRGAWGKASGLFNGFRSGLSSLRSGISEGVDGLRRMDRSFLKVRRSADKAGRQAKKSGGLFKKMRKFIYSGDPNATRILGMTGTGWMVSAVAAIAAPAISAISGIAAALPALGGVAVAGVAALALGFEGIKDAASAAAPAVDNLKSELSEVFRQRMTPQFEQLGKVLTDITPQMNKVANGFSDFTAGIVEGVSSPKSLAGIQEFLSNSADLLSDLNPFARDFTEGLADMAEIGSRTFPHLAKGLNSFGKSFKDNIAELGKSGELQEAIEATYDVLGSFGTNIGKIFESGIQQAPKMRDALVPLFDGLGDGISDLMPLFSDLSSFIGVGIGELASELGDLGQAIGPGLGSFFRDTAPGLREFIDAAGGLAGVTLTPIASFFEGLGPGLGDTLSLISDGIRNISGAFDGLNTGSIEGKISGLNDAMKSLGETAGEFFPSMVGAFEESTKDLEAAAPDPEDYEGFFGFAAFSFDTYISDIKRSVSMMKDAWSEATSVSKDMSLELNLDSLRSWNVGALGDLEAVISQFKGEAEAMADSVRIDISPQIEALESATTIQEFNAAKQDIISALESASEDFGKVEPAVKVDPKVDIEGAVAALEATLPADMANLNGTIDRFIFEAQAVSKQLDVDISPKIQVLRDANTEGEAQNAVRAILDSITAAGTTTDSSVDVTTKPNVSVDPATDTAAASEQMKSQVQTDMQNALNGLGADLNVDTSGVSAQVATSMETSLSTALASVGDTIGTALGSTPIDTMGLSTNVGNAISTALTSVAITPDVSGIGGSIGSALAGISIPTDGLTSTVDSAVSSALSAMSASVSASLVLDLTTNGADAGNTFVSGLEETQGSVQAAADSLKSAAEISPPNNYSSGVAVGSTFAAGIRSQIEEVSSAASALVAAARDKFPNSPAKEGPFSGEGWIDKSGDAVGITFATGLRRQVKNVSDAASELTGAARAEFNDIATAPESTMRAFQKKKILDPVLEHNAEQYARFREANEKAEEAHQKRLGQIAESKAKDKSKSLAKADEDYQKRLADNRKRLEESLKEPDYTEIDLSFNSYWVNGLKEMFKEKLGNLAHDLGLADKTRAAAKEAIRVGREQFGDHPIFAQVEANVDSEHFEWTVEEAIRESGLNEVPINFVIDNLNQLKKDLNMGDGVVSRGIDVAMDYNFNDTDDKRYADYKQNTEVHYHVEDMNEAIRLEQLRERKKMMKVR